MFVLIARTAAAHTALPQLAPVVVDRDLAATNASDGATSKVPGVGTWSLTGSLHTARAYCTATLLPNGMLLVAGGTGGGSSALRDAELYNPATGTWTVTGSLHNPRYQHTATLRPTGWCWWSEENLKMLSLSRAQNYTILRAGNGC